MTSIFHDCNRKEGCQEGMTQCGLSVLRINVSFSVDMEHVAIRDGSPLQPHGARQISRNYVNEFTVLFNNDQPNTVT